MDFIYAVLPDKQHEDLGVRRLFIKKFQGPSSYTTGGFNILLGEVFKVEDALVTIENDNTPYKLETSISGNTITVKVNKLQADTSTGAISTVEESAGVDLSGITFKVVAIVY